MAAHVPAEVELPGLAEGTSQTDSEGYWNGQDPEGYIEGEDVDAESGAVDDKKGHSIVPPDTADPGTESAGIVKRKREDEDEPRARPTHAPPVSSIGKGKGKATLLGSDDDLWANFSSPRATQASTDSSETRSQDTSATSVLSSSSVKRKRTQDSFPSLLGEMSKTFIKSSGSSASAYAQSVFVPEIPRTVCDTAGVIIIAHDHRVQDLMDKYIIAWGTQYEIARGVIDGRWNWDSITDDKLRQLIGTNAQSANRVSSLLDSKYVPPQAVPIPSYWAELDREQAAILENADRGLGLRGNWLGCENWYGGRIQQVAKMKITPDSVTVKLEKLQQNRSHRFARFLGSRRVLQIKIESDSQRDVSRIRDLLTKRFVLCGRVFAAFSTKDEKVYLMETSEDYERRPLRAQGDEHRRSLEEFVQWHNPMLSNQYQPIAKWATRFDLGLSNSIPVLRFGPAKINIIPDKCAEHGGGKMPAEKIFTDGCGFMNRAALAAIARHIDADRPFTAVQGRLFGAKGLWALHPHEHKSDSQPEAWIRESQLKINLVNVFPSPAVAELHPAHFIFDLVAPSKITRETRLNRLAIVNLAHNGVPRDCFINRMKSGLEEEIEALSQWDGPHSSRVSWAAVNRNTGASVARQQQLANGAQRALGHSRKREADEDIDDPGGTSVASSDTVLVKTLISGKPLSVPEEVLRLLAAGFTPSKEMYLFDTLKTLVSWHVNNTIKKCHIPIPNSADAFIIPDPLNVLNEGEIHFSSSEDLLDPIDNVDAKTLVGDVLLYRNPARLPSDIRKVRAVNCISLRRYTDVIILPTTGTCSLASLLAGGDVDGDVAVCIWDRDIVNAFTNAPITLMPSKTIEEHFEPESNIELVSSVCEKMRTSPDTAQELLQCRLLSGIADSRVGIYSNYHENAVYALGYDHKETLRLAHMFNILLDSRKTGHVVRGKSFSDDKWRYGRDPPPCMADGESYSDQNPNHLRRAKNLPKFILDELLSMGQKIKDDQLAKWDGMRADLLMSPGDPAILKVYQRVANVSQYQSELQVIIEHVKRYHERWREMWNMSPKKAATSRNKEKKKLAKQQDAEKVRALVAEYTRGLPAAKTPLLDAMQRVAAVAASYAYTLSAKFAFTVAFRDLSMIKAEACGITPMTEDMAVVMTIAPAMVRLFNQCRKGVF